MIRTKALLTLVAALLVACAPSAPSRPPSAAEPARATIPKTIVAGISGDPRTMYADFGAAGVRGGDALNFLMNSGLTTADHTRTLRPQLATTIPTIENGLWQLLPDGGMELIWTFRDGARWHDGAPLTVDDLAFTARLLRDPDLPFPLQAPTLARFRDVEVVNGTTFRTRWDGLYLNADQVFGSIDPPLPKHLLEDTYLNNKAQVPALAYWTTAYVGTGPYKLKDWVFGSSISMDAFDGYALGRPKIDAIEIRFILDANVLFANVMAGNVDVSLARSFSPDQGKLAREQWADGRVDVGILNAAISIWPQLNGPDPAIVGSVPFRRALYQALDRQAMVDTLGGGLGAVAHSWLMPNIPEYPRLEHYVVKYPYDARVASQELEALGFTRGADGAYRNAGGQRLSFELRSIALPDLNARSQLIVRDDWQKAGLAVEIDTAAAQNTERSYYRDFPAFFLVRYPADLWNGEGAVKQRLAPASMNQYSHPEFDPLVERFERTIARDERLEVAGQMVQHMSAQVTAMPLFYDPGIGLVNNRLLNVPPMGDRPPWNAHEWDVK